MAQTEMGWLPHSPAPSLHTSASQPQSPTRAKPGLVLSDGWASPVLRMGKERIGPCFKQTEHVESLARGLGFVV